MNYIEQAYKGKNHWLLYIASLIIIFTGWQFIGAIPLLITAILHSPNINTFLKDSENNFMNLGIDKNLLLFLLLFTFLIGLLSLFFSIKKIHKRSITSLITSRKKIDWNRFIFSFILWGLIASAITFIGTLLEPESYVFNFKLIPFLFLVLVSFVMLPIQTSCEELLFRGYLMQGIGILAKNRWVPLLLTSIMFGLLHGLNPEVQKMGAITMVFYIGTGLLFGITTLMDEGTEIALGLHAANNIVAALFVTTEWSALQTDAIYIDISEPDTTWHMFFPVLVLYPILLFILSKKYGWNNWKEKLFGKVIPPTELDITDKI